MCSLINKTAFVGVWTLHISDCTVQRIKKCSNTFIETLGKHKHLFSPQSNEESKDLSRHQKWKAGSSLMWPARRGFQLQITETEDKQNFTYRRSPKWMFKKRMYVYTLPKLSFSAGINVRYPLWSFYGTKPENLLLSRTRPCGAHEYQNPKFINTAQKRHNAKLNDGKVNSTYYVLCWHHQACLQIRQVIRIPSIPYGIHQEHVSFEKLTIH